VAEERSEEVAEVRRSPRDILIAEVTEEAKKRRVNGQAAYLLACRGPGSKSTGRESQ